MKRIYRDQGDCTCHQASGDSWDCPEHYRDNRRFREAFRVAEIVTGIEPDPQTILMVLRKIDKENAERERKFWKEAFAELDRRGL